MFRKGEGKLERRLTSFSVNFHEKIKRNAARVKIRRKKKRRNAARVRRAKTTNICRKCRCLPNKAFVGNKAFSFFFFFISNKRSNKAFFVDGFLLVDEYLTVNGIARGGSRRLGLRPKLHGSPAHILLLHGPQRGLRLSPNPLRT